MAILRGAAAARPGSFADRRVWGRLPGFGVFLLVLWVATWAVWLTWRAISDPDHIKQPEAVTFAAIAAMTGWIVSAYIARRNSIKQHTMNVLTQVRISTEMNSRLKKVGDTFPVGTKISIDDVKKKTL